MISTHTIFRWYGSTFDLVKSSVGSLCGRRRLIIFLDNDSELDLLHAGASYLRIHQKGFGAVGVSTKYGKRAFARYPIFWGIKDVGGLPNPDPTDTAAWSGQQVKTEEIFVDEELEASKAKLKRQAQNWAGFVHF